MLLLLMKFSCRAAMTPKNKKNNQSEYHCKIIGAAEDAAPIGLYDYAFSINPSPRAIMRSL